MRLLGQRSARGRGTELVGGLLALAIAAAGAPATAPVATAQERSVPPPIAAIPPLEPTDPSEQPRVDSAALAGRLAPLLADPALGPKPGTAVLDADSGSVAYGVRTDEAMIPASSLKLVTALSVLTSRGPVEQLTTSVVRNPDGNLVLVGGGDPSLRTVTGPDAEAYPAGATLADLAEQTAAALAAEGTTSIRLLHDSTLFSGPARSPDWDDELIELGIVGPVSALTVDPTSPQIDDEALDADPAAAVAAWFAARLTAEGLGVTGVAPGRAAAKAEPVAEVVSPPISALLDRMLRISDNDFAEAMLRQAAIGRGLPGDFASGFEAAKTTLAELGIATPGLVLRDGSGLSRKNRLAPITLAKALQAAADPLPELAEDSDPEGPASAAALTWAPPGLAVAGLTGSLAERFDEPDSEDAAGRVHAKTGTLTGISSLTGVVSTEQGRPVVFAFLSNGNEDTEAAREALDRLAAAVAGCGCAAAAP